MKNMSNNELIEWLRDHISEDGSIETASYADQLTIIHLKGQTCQLPDSWGHANCHISLQLYSGELRLMANSLRVGFESPALIDFIMGYDWKNMDLLNDFQAYILLSKHEFFMNSTARLRSKIADLMLHFAEHPFVQLERERVCRLKQLTELLFSSLNDISNPLQTEQIQMLLCATECELWNAISLKEHNSINEKDFQEKDRVAQFFYLMHSYCREQHEVRWYASQLCCSPDALSASLKRFYGKNASMLLNERLIAEAKVLLQKPECSIQDVADMLCFSDQSAFGKFFKRHCNMSPMQYRFQAEEAKRKEAACKESID